MQISIPEAKYQIIVGGTGFYIQALLYDIDFTENEGDSVYREKLEALAKEKGAAYLHGQLAMSTRNQQKKSMRII